MHKTIICQTAIKKYFSILCSSVIVIFSSLVFSSDCIKVRGNIHTTVLDLADETAPTLGTFSFKTRFDHKTCGIQGAITGVNDMGLPTLAHQMACHDHTTFSSTDSVVNYEPLDECRAKVVELSKFIPGHGDFDDYEGKLKTKGIINMCTGENNFKYKGKLCSKDD